MTDASSVGIKIAAIVMVIVMAIVAFFLYGVIQQNADRYLSIFENHCAVGETQLFTKIFLTNAQGEIATRAATIDTVNTAPTATNNLTCNGYWDEDDPTKGLTFTVVRDRITALGVYAIVDQHRNPVNGLSFNAAGPTPSGVLVGASTAAKASGGVVTFSNTRAQEPLPITEFLSDLSQIIIKLYPILGVVGFLSLTGTSLVRIVQGGMANVGVTQIVGAIGAMILAVVVMNVSPAVIEAADGAFEWTDADRLPIMEGFGGIASLIIRFFPVVWSAGLLGLLGANLAVSAMNIREMRG